MEKKEKEKKKKKKEEERRKKEEEEEEEKHTGKRKKEMCCVVKELLGFDCFVSRVISRVFFLPFFLFLLLCFFLHCSSPFVNVLCQVKFEQDSLCAVVPARKIRGPLTVGVSFAFMNNK